MLPPLDEADIDELLEAHARSRHGCSSVRRLQELTAGNPLLLAELLSMGPPERVVTEWTSPPRVRDIARKRTAELGRATAEILKHASLFEHDFTVELLAETAGTSVGTTAALFDRAVEAHVLQPSTIHSYRFAHQLFRHSLAADLPAAQRADGHRRIALALEREAGIAGAARRALERSIGRPMSRRMSFVRTRFGRTRRDCGFSSRAKPIRWFELALVNLTDEADRGSLLAELFEAQQFAGDPRCLATLQEAVDIALATR